MLIAIASDHAGYYLKEKLKKFLLENSYRIIDLGTDSTDSVDYPDYAKKLCELYLDEEIDFGILICGTGIGMSISANRFSSIRAALCLNSYMAEKARQHNDANILAIGSKILTDEEAYKITKIFLETPFEGGRHIARIEKL